QSVAAEQAIKDAQLWTVGSLAGIAGELGAIGTILFAAHDCLQADRPSQPRNARIAAEPVRLSAKLCRYCRSDVSATMPAPSAQPIEAAGSPSPILIVVMQ